MSSRLQEKERRRQERLERERAAAAAAERRKRLGFAAGGGVAIAALPAVAIAIAAGGGGSNKPNVNPGGADIRNVALPPAQPGSLDATAKAAGCVNKTFPSEGRSHTLSTVQYKTNPPTSGDHNPTPAHDGIYGPGSTPETGMLVHSLEHGRIEVQYKPGTPTRMIGQLQTLVTDIQDGGDPRILLFQNGTGMRYQVAATAWTHLLGCTRMNDRVFDAIRAFTKQYDLKAPEVIPAVE